MPTPVSTARQCLTTESASALDEAVGVARRRGHAQTTSLHAVSALLSLPSSTVLRDACARSRNSAYSPRLQFKALELCLSVSLDRVPASQLAAGDEPPVSNSLMAAIKRSQANQRRQPENFQLYHQIAQQQQQQQQSQSSAISCIKVELQNLILSILDDPVVSRVFGEAGFRSSEIKLAIIRPLPQVLNFKFSRFKPPPLFLCNLGDNPDPTGLVSFSSPSLNFSNGDDNCRRIAEVLARSKGRSRNPLLVGVCAYDALDHFSEIISDKRKGSIFPPELSGLSANSIEDDVRRFLLSEDFDKGGVDSRFEEVGRFADQSLGAGLVMNLGDVKRFVNHEIDANSTTTTTTTTTSSYDARAGYLVEKLTRMLQQDGGKLWVIGAVATYETYLKFVSRFPSVEKDWDLQLLPITSLTTSMAESYPRSSLMRSFVPFGGFFSTTSEIHEPLMSSSSYHCPPRCHQCNDKYEQEVVAASKGGFTASVADEYQSSLPSWLQMVELDTTKDFDFKTRDNGVVLSTKIRALQRKWDGICQRFHHTQSPGPNVYPSRFPTVVGFRLVHDRKEDAENISSSSNGRDAQPNLNANSCIRDWQGIPRKQQGVPFAVVSEAKTPGILAKPLEKPSKDEHLELSGLQSRGTFSNSSMGNSGQASPASVTSVTTDLGLRISTLPTSAEKEKPVVKQNHRDFAQDLSRSSTASVHIANGSISDHLVRSSSSSAEIGGQYDANDFKTLFRALTERVGWQDEAIRTIAQAIAQSRERNANQKEATVRGDIWLNFIGPDRYGKRKVAAALAEIIYRRRENFISADLSSKDGVIHTDVLFDRQDASGYDVMFRGKTIVDYVAGELRKNPLSVVFLENVDKADVQAQISLSHAIRTGKFSDSHGREVRINNSIFVTTSSLADDQILFSRKQFSSYSEERIMRTKAWPMKISVEQTLGDKMGHNFSFMLRTTKAISTSSVIVNKRKSVGVGLNSDQHGFAELVKRAHKTSTGNLDLNLPADENDDQVTGDGNSDSDSASDSSKSWMQEFLDRVDRIAVFKPFDFDSLAESALRCISDNFHKILGPECSLEIDPKVMEQLLSAAYLSDGNRVVEDWADRVLSWAFLEVTKRYNMHGSRSIVKLSACEDLRLEEQEPGPGLRRLPPKIIFN